MVIGGYLFCLNGLAQASNLQIIGTATYASAINTANNTSLSGTENVYNLIWDKDVGSNGSSVIWLDYRNGSLNWQNQTSWAAGLDTSLTYNFEPGYNVDWDSSWRLPSAGDNPVYADPQATSEMGHLFFSELGHENSFVGGSTTTSELNNSVFNNLFAGRYWTSTEAAPIPDSAWLFYMDLGTQYYAPKHLGPYGLAVRSGQVTTATPIPGAVWLLGSGIVGLVGLRRKKKS